MSQMTNVGNRRLLALPAAVAAVIGLVACASPTAPDDSGSTTSIDGTPPDTVTVLPATSITRSSVTPAGTVVETEDGFTVDGSLTMGVSDTSAVTFLDADVRVRFDENDRMTSISGSVEIPSPHERISFDDPVRAEVGLFTGKFLNEERDLGILLKDDTEYFVFDLSVALRMNIATGETGEDATKPVYVQRPIGGGILMVVDYTDPMYYVYGEHDLLGATGFGRSFNGRLPFVPQRPVEGLGTFDGQNIRTGTFPIFKVFSVAGTTIDNKTTEVHLVAEDPFSSDLRTGFQQGWNGDFELDLSIKDVLGFVIPVADGSGGIFAEASTEDVFEGHAYGVGETTDDFSWFPTFIPVKPASRLGVSAFVTHTGDFEVGLSGQYGWEFPSGVHGMAGSFAISDEAMELEGSLLEGSIVWTVGARVEADQTTAYLEPPEELMDALSAGVNDKVMGRIDEAQEAWENLKEATSDYEIELSLRGLRTQLPAIVDAAKSALSSGIANELKKHEGKIYYGSLRSQLHAADDPYYAALDRLKAAALNATDNDATRNAIASALRSLAAKKVFTTTYRYYDPVFGTLLYTVNVSRRIMSDAQAAKLIEAANNVWRIQETSSIKISMQQIYDEVDDKALFEGIRDDIREGLVVIGEIGQLGFTYPHSGGGAFHAFAVIGGKRYEVGTIEGVTVAGYATLLLNPMIDALTRN